MSAIRVRFAPSPTGFLHVGGARTAIFNWLYARHTGGTFVLRIEDTDDARSSDEMVRAILDGMAWLGMTPDEGPFFQSKERARHLEDAARLVTDGHAYRCFCGPEAVRHDRTAADQDGGRYRYPRTCLGLAPGDSDRRAAAGEPFAIRVRVPERPIAWDDAVHGPTSFDGSTLEDFVIVRSDGTPTYPVSVVSDDIAMGITDVVRGDDHISNTPKQIVLYEALGANVPRFAHLPLILGADKKRLSKRHGAISVLEYREAGYLAEAMFNFLALLGWNPGDGTEKLSHDMLVARFGFDGVGRSGAVFDLAKLEWLNGRYIDDLASRELVEAVRPHLERAGLWSEEFRGMRAAWLESLLALLQPRCRTLEAFVEQARPFLDPSDDLPYEDKPTRKHLREAEVADRLRVLRERLAACPAWIPEPLEAVLRAVADEHGVSAGKLIHPTRLAVTGRGASPGLFEVLEVLGRDRTLARIDRLIRLLDAGAVPTASA